MAEPDDKPLADSPEPFLSRWSRLKEEARQAPAAPGPGKAPEGPGPAPDLPPLDQVTSESDFRAFFHPKVGEEVRRAALKKLFSDPRFNVMDGLDVYIDDYSKTEPIPEAMMKGLRQAQMILASAKEDADERERTRLAQAGLEPGRELPPPSSGAEGGTLPTAKISPDSGEADSTEEGAKSVAPGSGFR
jgi:hypothetical protein